MSPHFATKEYIQTPKYFFYSKTVQEPYKPHNLVIGMRFSSHESKRVAFFHIQELLRLGMF